MPPQILITGATGFIGRRLTRDLVRRGESVRVLARDRRKARLLFGDNVEIFLGDVTDGETLAAACLGIETVYHIAGTYRFGLRHRRELWAVNVEGTENLLRAADTAGVRKVVHLSSGGVLKKSDPDATLLDENDFPTEPPRLCFYKASKWHAEKRAQMWAQRGLPVVIASTTCPIGSGDETPTPTGEIVRDFLRRRFPFYCRTGLNFIGLGDLSHGLQLAAQAGKAGRRYLLSGENLWLKEFLDLLARETGMPAPRLALPHAFIQLVGCGGEEVNLLSQRGTNARACIETALQAAHLQFFDNSRTRGELGWHPVTPLRESIAEAVAWFRRETEMELTASEARSVESHVR